MIFDAIVLAGGRSSRLAGSPKALLSFEGRTLVGHTLDAAQDARRRVLVGDPVVLGGVLGETLRGRAVLLAREDPPFSGPAAGIAAGFAVLSATARDAASTPRADDVTAARSEFVLVLACDMPRIRGAVEVLLAAGATQLNGAGLQHPGGASGAVTGPGTDGGRPDGFFAQSPDGRLQPLAGLYRTAALGRCIDGHRSGGTLENLSVRALLGSLQAVPVVVPEGSTDDIDTPEDAEVFGIGLP